MPFNVVWPIVTRVDGDSFKEAIKNFVKINRRLNIEKIIVTDQQRHVEATFNYHKHDIRNRVGINFYPADPITLRNYGLLPLLGSPLMGTPGVGVGLPGVGTAAVLGRPGTHTVVNSGSRTRSFITPPGLPGAVVTTPMTPVISPTGPLRGDGLDVGPRVGVATPVTATPGIVTSRSPIITSPTAPGVMATDRAVMVGNKALGPLRFKKNATIFPRVVNL